MCTEGLGAHFGLPPPPQPRGPDEETGGIPRFFAEASQLPRHCYVRHTVVEAVSGPARTSGRRSELPGVARRRRPRTTDWCVGLGTPPASPVAGAPEPGLASRLRGWRPGTRGGPAFRSRGQRLRPACLSFDRRPRTSTTILTARPSNPAGTTVDQPERRSTSQDDGRPAGSHPPCPTPTPRQGAPRDLPPHYEAHATLSPLLLPLRNGVWGARRGASCRAGRVAAHFVPISMSTMSRSRVPLRPVSGAHFARFRALTSPGLGTRGVG